MGNARGDGWREDQQGRESKGRVAADGAGESMGESTRELSHGSGTSPGEAGCSQLTDSSKRQTQPALGGDSHGTSDWLDDAELYSTCDNRTDELRLLGNGVVPATAEKAFSILLNEIQKTTTTAD
jgi:hypothetical protein